MKNYTFFFVSTHKHTRPQKLIYSIVGRPRIAKNAFTLFDASTFFSSDLFLFQSQFNGGAVQPATRTPTKNAKEIAE